MKTKPRRHSILVAVLVLSWVGAVSACQPAPPVIADFSCSPAEISAGESATLSWVVRGATRVSIDKGVGMVDAVGTKEVSPSKTTTYTLLAINSGVVVSSSVVVTVGAASPPSPDTTAPVITNLSASSITAASAVVMWATDEPATSQVEYGTTTDYGSTTTLDDELVTSHSVSLTGLEADTTYHFRVASKDASENEAASTDETFTTSAEADTSPPVISGVAVSNVTESGATVSWETDEPATSQVEYGMTTSYGSTSTLDEELVTSHSVSLAGLEADTTYHFRVKSEDTTGNEATWEDKIFTTSAVADTTPPVPEIEMNYSWHLESNYTSVPIYITNRSDYSVDVTFRLKTFDSQDVTIYDESHTLRDIWPEETFYSAGNTIGTQTAKVTVTITSASETTVPPISNRTDLVIVDDIPITTEPNSSPRVRIQNTTGQSLTAPIKLRRYDSDGYIRETSRIHNLGIVEPSETKLFRMEWTGGTPTPQEYFIYLVD